MGPLQKLYQVETKKLFLVIGIITSIVITTQFFLPPYKNVLSLARDSNPKSEMMNHSVHFSNHSTKLSLVDGVVSNTDQFGEETKRNDEDRTGYVSPLLAVPPAYFPINLNISKVLLSDPVMPPIAEKHGLLLSGPTMPPKSEKPGLLRSSITMPSIAENSGLLQSRSAMPSKKEKHGLLLSGPTMPPKAEKPGLLRSSITMPSIAENPGLLQIRSAMHSKKEKHGLLRSAPATSYKNSSVARRRVKKDRIKVPPKVITSIAEMNVLLHQSRASSGSTRPQWYSLPDLEVLSAKSQIENAPIIKNDRELYAPVFRNVSMFKRSYELMEQLLKVFIYSEGSKPIFHQPILDGIYASEGWFMKLMEANKQFVINDPEKAHLFYLPFSTQVLRYTLYVPDSHKRKNLISYLKNYMSIITVKYPFWNRTDGADHFLVACHDWAPSETKHAMGGSIRALCNADVNEAGFVMGKDVSLPETNIRSVSNPLEYLGGKPPLKREILAFFAGRIHGYLRPILLKHWGNKDPDIKIYGGLNSNVKVKNYVQYMRNSKYCICARGFEVNSPRVVEAIFYECVPVIISDNFVPPFFDVLDWEAFAVFVPEKDIPNLKNILLSIPEDNYLEMQKRVKKVQQHFLWHAEPVKYDIFHMILHSIWYNRVFQTQPR